ncbi:MAG: hypothetical protein RBR02_06000 [Desulfuromonadaceae bacterium]|nr:hypothetical protein [Desulfuromonadaceae bacterium]
MKALTKTVLVTLITLGATMPAVASTAGRTDHSGILVWTFLGFCALIIVAQLVPAAMMMLGIVKGVATSDDKVSDKG